MPSKKIISNTLILLIALFYLFNLRNGHDWGGDFALYIMHANNLVHGIPYAQTGYIYNPDAASYGPQAYPPVFPILLAPLIYFFGVNLLVLKLPGIFCFICFLLVLNNRIIDKEFPEGYRILLIGLVGLSPVFFLQSESILSELPFLFFSGIALYFINGLFTTKEKSPGQWRFDLLTGFLIYVSYGTRTIGILLIPVTIILFLIRKRRSPLSLIITLGTALVLIMVQNLTIPATSDYFSQISGSFTIFIAILVRLLGNYFTLFIELFQINNILVQCLIFLILLEFCVLGMMFRIKNGISSYEIYFPIYLASLLFWPSYQGYRFLVPIIPFFFLFSVEGIYHFMKSIIRSERTQKIVPFVILCAVLVSYAFSYRVIFPRPISDMEKTSTKELFDFVKNETKPKDVIVFFKPRVLALYTNRQSLAIALPDPKGDPLSRMKEFGVNWVITRKIHPREYQPELIQLISENPDRFIPVYENEDFRVFRLAEK